jgi:hypothetical protein
MHASSAAKPPMYEHNKDSSISSVAGRPSTAHGICALVFDAYWDHCRLRRCRRRLCLSSEPYL